MQSSLPGQLEWQQYAQRLSPERKAKMEKIAATRIDGVRLVIQDIFHPHNIAACLRSAEAFGVEKVDVIAGSKDYATSNAAKGVTKWLSVQNWENAEDCYQALIADGFQICAAYPAQDSIPMEQIPVMKPVALVFGNEQQGLGPYWREQAHLKFHIPMRGFVESLNISVAAAVCMQQVTQKWLDVHGSQMVSPSRWARLARWAAIQA